MSPVAAAWAMPPRPWRERVAADGGSVTLGSVAGAGSRVLAMGEIYGHGREGAIRKVMDALSGREGWAG